MTEFPLGITLGLILVLIGTGSFIAYILLLDKIEEQKSNVRIQDQENHQNH